jgi:hypothetical protein
VLEPGPSLQLSDGARIEVKQAALASEGSMLLTIPLSSR